MSKRTSLVAALAVSVLGVSMVTANGRAVPSAEDLRGPAGATLVAALPAPAAGTVTTEADLRAAWADPSRTRIDLGADIVLRDCTTGDPIRESPYAVVVDGHGHVVRQACFEKRILRQDGTGHLTLSNLTLTRGGADGPGAAVTSRGEITILDSVIKQNLSEEPGGGVFSMRRVTVHRSRINGNLANDDGGGVYARRGGVAVYDSVLSNNLVDGSGGAIGSTGDILVVRSEVDGNTTDGDGGALYADEDGDVTVVDSVIDGSDADGPGGAVFTLDGDVAVLESTLIGNRADDRGGAVSGEGDVLLVNSTVARNLAVAHAGGGIWARGNLMLVNSTVTNNYAEGEGGGTLSAGRTTLLSSTLNRNIASVGADVGAAGTLTAGNSIVGPPTTEGVTGDTIPTRRACRVYQSVSLGHNFLTDDTCELDDPTSVRGDDPQLAQLEDDPLGFVLVPRAGSPVLDRIPAASCVPTLPEVVPAGQLLAQHLDWDRILRHDAVGTPRDDGGPCDVGAVEFPSTGPPAGVARHPAGRAVEEREHTTFAPNWATEGQRRVARPSSGGAGPARVLPGAVTGPLAALDRRLRTLTARATALLVAARRSDLLQGCTTPLQVDRIGDPRHAYGLEYDERDGTGVDTRTALSPHLGTGRAELQLLRLSRDPACLSRPADPNGSGAPARALPLLPAGLASLRAQVRALRQRVALVTAAADRFDTWESCLTWLPVTEDGDERQDLGFVADGRHLPAIDVDDSPLDDPDYQLLAFVGGDRPGSGECRTEPGEAADRLLTRRSRVALRSVHRASARSGAALPDLRALVAAGDAAEEDLDDLAEPVDDITRFDECLYTVGARSREGYTFRDAAGARSLRAALSFDLAGPGPAAYDLMAFPGEEPPQIECNEDAGGLDTDE